MSAPTARVVSWGEGLIVEAFKSPGGLKAAVELIQREVGSGIGTRNTFAKLMHVEDPSALTDKDQWRAWLLLCVFQEDPDEWGISDDVVPPAINKVSLREALWCAIRDSNPEPAGLESTPAATVSHLRERRSPVSPLRKAS